MLRVPLRQQVITGLFFSRVTSFLSQLKGITDCAFDMTGFCIRSAYIHDHGAIGG